MDTRFKDDFREGRMALLAAYAGNPEEAKEWAEEIRREYPGTDLYMDSLSLSVACHVGPGVLAIACARKAE